MSWYNNGILSHNGGFTELGYNGNFVYYTMKFNGNLFEFQLPIKKVELKQLINETLFIFSDGENRVFIPIKNLCSKFILEKLYEINPNIIVVII